MVPFTDLCVTICLTFGASRVLIQLCRCQFDGNAGESLLKFGIDQSFKTAEGLPPLTSQSAYETLGSYFVPMRKVTQLTDAIYLCLSNSIFFANFWVFLSRSGEKAPADFFFFSFNMSIE